MEKAYIVANKEQEINLLNKFEQDRFDWPGKRFEWPNGEKPTGWLPSKKAFSKYHFSFPYTIVINEDNIITWSIDSEDYDGDIVFDGRKENNMNKYLVTQEFMDKLSKWRDDQRLGMNTELIRSFLDVSHIQKFPDVVDIWWTDPKNTVENNSRLIAIIQWLNGEEVFETQKTYKYYVGRDSYPIAYLSMRKMYHSEFPRYDSVFSEKKIFDTREEAEKWLIPDYEVVEIDENEL